MRFGGQVARWVVALALAGGPAAAKEGAVMLDPLTVTANKMEEDVRTIPMSVQVITGEQLEEAGIRSVEPLLRRIPNMMVSKNYGAFTSPNYRGLNTSRFSQESPVTIYVDGVPYFSTYGMDVGLVNVDRVEVLRGAQSTIYGQYSIGGVINIISRKEPGVFYGKGTAELGQDGHRLLSASTGGELVPNRLSANLAVLYEATDGYLKNNFGASNEKVDGTDYRQLNARIDWQSTEDLEITLVLNSQWQDNGVLPMVAGDDIIFDTAQEVEGFNEIRTHTQSLRVNYDLGPAIATYLLANKKTDVAHKSDLDRTTGTIFDGAYFFDESVLESTSHELRFVSPNAEGMRWVAGLYYFDGLYDAEDNGLTVPGVLDSHTFTDVETKQYSVFGQVTVPISEPLEATLGIRYQRDEKQTDFSSLTVLGGMDIPTAYRRDATWNVWLPKVALAYIPTDRITVYGSVSRGYMPGGFNFTEPNPDAAKFEPQISIDYELGVKTAWWDYRILADLNLFYLDLEDVHGVSIDALNQTRIFNVDKAYSRGAELDVSVLLDDGWRLDGHFGYTDAEYESDVFSGKRIPYTPRFSAIASIGYDVGEGLFGNLEYLYLDKAYTDAANTLELDAYGVVNGRIGYTFRAFSGYVFVENLFDEEYATNLYTLPLPGTQQIRTVGAPQTFGVGVRIEF